jgi:hypothetical protein
MTGGIEIRQLTEDDILPGFSILSFNLAGTGFAAVVQRGSAISSVTAMASYSSTPVSASINNSYGGSVNISDIHGGSWTINSPFTSAFMAGSIQLFGSDLGANPTWASTLTATKTPTRTVSVIITWASIQYWGVGAPGINTGAGVIALGGSQLSAGKIGSFTVSPANQKVYYALPQELGTATLTLDGFTAAMNAPTTVSVTSNGITRTYYLYESTYLLTGTSNTFVVS